MSASTVADPALESPGAIRLGEAWDGASFVYDLETATNFNAGICGVTGSGKTHLIRRLIRGYHSCGVDTFILDVHGDLANLPGVDPAAMQDLHFSHHAGDTINPLRVTGYDGPYVVARQFVEAVKLFNPALGSKQQPLLQRAVERLFAEWGIEANEADTWPRPSPTLADLASFIRRYVNAADAGIPYESTAEAVRKQIKEADKAGDADQAHEALYEAGNLLYQAYSGDMPVEDDILDKNRDTLSRLLEIIESMQRTGLFGADSVRPARESGAVTRFVIHDLLERDQQVIAYLLISRIFSYMVRSAPGLDPAMPRGILVLDEGKIVNAISRSTMSPLNRAATEGRKFGLGLVLGVQSVDHLTSDVIDACGLFCLLRQHPRRIDDARRKLAVSADRVKALEPRRDALVHFGGSGYIPIRVTAE